MSERRTRRASAPRPAAPRQTPTRAAPSSETNGTVRRTVRLLAALADAGGDVSVGALAEQLGLPTSTVHRLLHLLCREGMVDWRAAEHRYAVGPEFFRVARRTVALAKIPDLAHPRLETLSQRFGEAAYLGLYLPGHRALSFVVRTDGAQPLQYRPRMNERLPLLWGASGRAILAFLPERVVSEVVREAEPSPTRIAPPDLNTLDAALRSVRETHYAVSEGHVIPGALSIAAPVFGAAGVIGCMKMTMPKERVPDAARQAIAASLVSESEAFSHQLGAPET